MLDKDSRMPNLKYSANKMGFELDSKSLNKINNKKIASGTENKIKDFIQKNKILVITLPISLLLIVVLIIINSKLNINKKTYTNTTKANKTDGKVVEDSVVKDLGKQANTNVEVLPQNVRIDDQVEDSGNILSQINPFEKPMILSGIFADDEEDNTAIIESKGKAYIVKKGDIIGKSWEVKEIKEDHVILNNEGKESVIRFKTDDTLSMDDTFDDAFNEDKDTSETNSTPVDGNKYEKESLQN